MSLKSHTDYADKDREGGAERRTGWGLGVRIRLRDFLSILAPFYGGFNRGGLAPSDTPPNPPGAKPPG